MHILSTPMKIELWLNGKTEPYVAESCERFFKRLKHYTTFQLVEIPEPKRKGNTDPRVLKQQEAQLLLPKIELGDYLVLLDEHGTLLPSTGFAQQMQKWMNTGPKRLVFAVGDAYGFPADFALRASFKLALGPMTLTHDMVRLVFVEQLYRAHTILRNEPYHHA